MAPDPETMLTDQSDPRLGDSDQPSSADVSNQLSGLSGLLDSTLQRLSGFEANLVQRAAELDEREQQIRLSEQDLDGRQQDLRERVMALSAERNKFERLRAELRDKLEHLKEQRQQFETERSEGAQRLEELAARESEIEQRENAIAEFQQAFAQTVAWFDECDDADPGDRSDADSTTGPGAGSQENTDDVHDKSKPKRRRRK